MLPGKFSTFVPGRKGILDLLEVLFDHFPDVQEPVFVEPRAGDIYRSVGSAETHRDKIRVSGRSCFERRLKGDGCMDAGITPRPRMHIRNRYVFLGDLALIIVSVMGSFALRLDVGQLPFYFPAILIMMGVALLTKVPVYYAFGLYRRLWIYASTSELRLITVAVTTASVLTSGLMLLLISFGWVVPGMPRSSLGIDWLLSLVLIGGSRFALRILAEQSASPRNGKMRKVLIIGAGDAGALVVRELQKTSQLNLLPIGFLDDDPAKQKHEINGVPVIGRIADLSDVLDNHPVDEVIIAIPSAAGNVLRIVTDVCRLKGIPSRTMPGIYELIGGKVSVSRLREVEITDLLRREPAKIDDRLVGSSLSGKRVLVTGAGGLDWPRNFPSGGALGAI